MISRLLKLTDCCLICNKNHFELTSHHRYSALHQGHVSECIMIEVHMENLDHYGLVQKMLKNLSLRTLLHSFKVKATVYKST